MFLLFINAMYLFIKSYKILHARPYIFIIKLRSCSFCVSLDQPASINAVYLFIKSYKILHARPYIFIIKLRSCSFCVSLDQPASINSRFSSGSGC